MERGAASPPHILTLSPYLTPPSPSDLTLQPLGKLPRNALYLVTSLCSHNPRLNPLRSPAPT